MKLKKQEVHDAILAAARAEFSEHGYIKATIAKIARRARTSPSNVYVYFQSKLQIVLAIYEPWLKRRVSEFLEKSETKSSKKDRLDNLVYSLWAGIPNRREGLTTPLIQALALATPDEKYDPSLLIWTENRIADELMSIFNWEEKDRPRLLAIAHMMMITFDGISLRRNLDSPLDRSQDMIEEMTNLLMLLARE